ncbi:Short chain dehydrogenase [Pleurostoma richardsiae]|uniref:Short chain dehydrogenase n=1 Tax=Pleurostoma richardsiae TaxID=41990 RepID=A0AA38RET4_9PEZI|nr:Short chain dehydrogenase [Pleurostoma richardsiae]
MSNKIITLITGANRGIGYETAKNLLLTSDAYHILLGSRDLSQGQSAAATLRSLPEVKGTVDVIQLDVRSDASVDAAVVSVTQAYGRLDILVNNAGVFRRGEPRAIAREIFETNVVGAISITEAFLPLLRASSTAGDTPRLVFLSSSTGSLAWASDPGSRYHAPLSSEYRAANAARNMLVVQYCTKLQPEGILVFGVDPGLVATEFVGNPEALRQRGAAEPEVGGERVASVIRGDRDANVGRVCGEYGVLPW